VASDLGAGTLGSLCASIVAASLPIGILEATSTQNDYAVAFWLVCAVVFATRARRPKAGPGAWAAFGASAGLALLTKATAYLVLLPLGLWLAAGLLRQRVWHAVGWLGLAGLLALALNAGLYARNVAVFGSPLGPPDEGAPTLAYTNAAMSPALLASNLVRDLGLNLVATPSVSVNVRSQAVVLAVETWLGVDVADPRTTWGEERFHEQPVGLAFDENFAANPIHLLLLLGALAAVGLSARLRRTPLGGYALVLAGAWLLFALVLRWQPWHTRLELPLFVLGAPLAGAVAERLAPRATGVLCVLLVASMVPYVAYNQARPLVGPRSILFTSRTDQYFTNQPSLRAPYEAAIGVLSQSGCRQIGFISTADGWEYPLRALLGPAATIEHVDVANVSAGQDGVTFDPCAVLRLTPVADRTAVLVGGRPYWTVWQQGEMAILLPDRGAAP
jgi:hypothetical protein